MHAFYRKEEEQMDLPEKGVEVPLAQIETICRAYGLSDLWKKIENDPPPKSFKSDGCSLWFDSWEGIDFYPACFFHDLKYWCGYSGESAERLIADAEFMIDIARAGAPKMAEIMFAGVRVGGHEALRRSFSWGFGRQTD
jgi:hypothetical protein